VLTRDAVASVRSVIVSTDVKYFRFDQTGAPALSGTAGALISLLDACLVNGFNLITLDSLAVSSEVATATYSAGHGYEVHDVILIDGATPSGLNGEWRITAVTSTTFTFAAVGIGDGSATGTITAKVASAGWTKAFTGTNKGAYKSSAVDATGCLLRVDDTGASVAANYAIVNGYETMSDVDTGTGPFPDGLTRYFIKSSAANSTERPWYIVADDRFFWITIYTNSTSSSFTYSVTYSFGDFIPLSGSDSYNCILMPSSTAADYDFDGCGLPRPHINYVPRGSGGLGGFQGCISRPSLNLYSLELLSGISTYPSPVTGGLNISGPVFVDETSLTDVSFATITYPLRGKLPGLYSTWENSSSLINSVTGPFILESVPGLTGIRLMPVPHGDTGTTIDTAVLIDITGPWR